MKKQKKNELGITLIILVIIIVILLILAGIGITALFQTELFDNAKKSKQKTIIAEQDENEKISNYSNLIEEVIGTRDETITINVNDLSALITQIVEDKIENINNSSNQPTGSILAQMGNFTPNGFLTCDGSTYNISDYKKLSDYIKEQFGSCNYFGGNGINTFAVPDLRGEFLRGSGTNSHQNQGSASSVGTHQDGTEDIFLHTYLGKLYVTDKTITPNNYDSIISSSSTFRYYDVGNILNGNNSGLYTSRPTNTSVLYCIKY